MKTVVDYQPFAEAAQLLGDLSAELAAMIIEQEGLRKQLSYSSQQGGEDITTEEAARRLAKGEPPPKNNAERIRAASERELIVRQRIEGLNKVLRDMPQVIEGHRRKARAEQIAALAGDVEAIRRDFEKARKAMLAACLAESRLLERLILGGFGGGDAWLTAPPWLNRNLMIEAGDE